MRKEEKAIQGQYQKEQKLEVENVQAASIWKCLNLMEYRIPFRKIKNTF